mmetsp:Transcript_111516/g.238226  ORF Transcript_111516/g.238226 Transcript_111516/m.238226 type:complete len:209 (+) Transcript_111516:709-1335(+)
MTNCRSNFLKHCKFKKDSVSAMRFCINPASRKRERLTGPPNICTVSSKAAWESARTSQVFRAMTVKLRRGVMPKSPRSPMTPPGPMSPMETSDACRCSTRSKRPMIRMPSQLPGSPWRNTIWPALYSTGITKSAMVSRKTSSVSAKIKVFVSSLVNCCLSLGSRSEALQRAYFSELIFGKCAGAVAFSLCCSAIFVTEILFEPRFCSS